MRRAKSTRLSDLTVAHYRRFYRDWTGDGSGNRSRPARLQAVAERELRASGSREVGALVWRAESVDFSVTQRLAGYGLQIGGVILFGNVRSSLSTALQELSNSRRRTLPEGLSLRGAKRLACRNRCKSGAMALEFALALVATSRARPQVTHSLADSQVAWLG